MDSIPDARLPRFFAPAPGGEFVDLPAEEAHHLTRVLRLVSGDEVAVFDGRGGEWRARVERTGFNAARLRLLERIDAVAEPRVAITLAQAILKGDGMDEVIRDATMLGAVAIQPLVTRRTIARAIKPRAEAALERWRRVAIASAKQCRRAVVPEIRPAAGFEEWMPIVENGVILTEPPAQAGGTVRFEPGPVTLIVGPEGGWEPSEIELALRAGCAPLTLGSLTLRAEVAPIVGIAALRTLSGDFRV